MNALAIVAILALSSQASANTAGQDGQRENPVFIQQAEKANSDQEERVFLPADEKEPGPQDQSVQQRATAPQLPPAEANVPPDQLSNERGKTIRATDQLTREEGRRALLQLTRADRIVLAQAVEGTDICESEPTVPAIIELCLQKIENRAEQFAFEEANSLSPEERLLGEGLDGDRVASLENAISRLARGQSSFSSDEDQAVASVALSQGALAPASEAPAEANESELSVETQALINAIVEQLGNQGGGGQ